MNKEEIKNAPSEDVLPKVEEKPNFIFDKLKSFETMQENYRQVSQQMSQLEYQSNIELDSFIETAGQDDIYRLYFKSPLIKTENEEISIVAVRRFFNKELKITELKVEGKLADGKATEISYQQFDFENRIELLKYLWGDFLTNKLETK